MGRGSSRLGARQSPAPGDTAASAQETTPLTPLRAIALPSEIIESILESTSTRAPSLSALDTDIWPDRHAVLTAASLVSRQWGAVAQRLLYGRLELKWEARSVENLLRTFNENPKLFGMVRIFVTMYTNVSRWLECWDGWDDAADEADVLFQEQEEFGDDHYTYIRSQALREAVEEGVAPWLRIESPGRQDGSDVLWGFVAKLSNLRTLSMEGVDMPIRPALLRKVAPVLAQLTTVGLSAESGDALSIFPLLHSVEVVCVTTRHVRDTPFNPPPPRTQRTGQLKYLRVFHFDNLDVLGLKFAKLVGLSLECIGEADLFNFSHNLFPSLVNLELLKIGRDSEDPFTEATFKAFCKSLSRTKLTQLYLTHWPTPRHLFHLPPTLSKLDLDRHNLKPHEASKLFESIPSWRKEYLPALKELVITPPYKPYAWTDEETESWEAWERDREALVRRTTTFNLRFRGFGEYRMIPGPWWML
ncbi:hypothetical protein RQP46_001693 [Phenoliferia psychrophenolica]